MSDARRRQLVRDYKERPASPGIFAVRCTASGEAWVQPSRNLDTQQNGVWFGLRLGTYPNPALQAAWKQHGEGAFVFEVVERIEGDLEPYVLNTRLKERAAHWRAELNAKPVAG